MALIAVAALGVVLIIAGTTWIFPPAGLIAAGVALVVGAYLIAEHA